MPYCGRMNYLNEQELNTVQGLLHYLNTNVAPNDGGLAIEATLTDSNGDNAGTIKWNAEPGAMYVLEFPEGDS